MSRTVPKFPPSVVELVRRPAGEVSVRYTLPARWRTAALPFARPLMETPYVDGLLVALVLEPSYRLRFIRTGHAEGQREASVDVADLMAAPCWRVSLRWDPDRLSVAVAPES